MIKHLVMDVDGVLNTGHFLYTEDGKFAKIFGPHDKDGLDIARKLGLTIDFVTADATGFEITRARIVRDWNFDESQLRKFAYRKGLNPLRISGALKVLDGITTIEEIFQVTSNQYD